VEQPTHRAGAGSSIEAAMAAASAGRIGSQRVKWNLTMPELLQNQAALSRGIDRTRL
jgi:hypothetical protein